MRKIDLDLENSIFSHVLCLCGELSETFVLKFENPEI